jgi:cytochrome c553
MDPNRRALIMIVATAASLGAAQAQDSGAVLRSRSLAATCAQCHGTDGRPPPGSIVPALAGLGAAYTIERMSEYKTGMRLASVMPQIARGYSDAQIRQLAAYFAAQAR